MGGGWGFRSRKIREFNFELSGVTVGVWVQGGEGRTGEGEWRWTGFTKGADGLEVRGEHQGDLKAQY